MARIPLCSKKLDHDGVYRSWLQARPGAGQAALPADLRVELQVERRTIPVPCRADGTLELPWRADWSGKDAKVRLNYPKERAGIIFHRTFRSTTDGKLELPWNPGWAAATVQLSAPLKSVDPAID